MDIQELSEKIRQQSAFCQNLLREVEDTVIGQKAMVESILTGILADGHVLLEGLPGLAKTTAVMLLLMPFLWTSSESSYSGLAAG